MQSVFGMTEFSIPATDWRFAVTMVLVCVPFMLLISILQTRSFGLLLTKLSAIAALPRRLIAFILRRGLQEGEAPDNRSTAALSQRRVRVRRGGRWTWPWGVRRTPPDEGIDLGGTV